MVWHVRDIYIAGAQLLALSLAELQRVQQEAVPGRAIACPSAQSGLLAHASQHKAAAFGNVQSIYKPLRWQTPELTQPLRACLALLDLPEPDQAIPRSACLQHNAQAIGYACGSISLQALRGRRWWAPLTVRMHYAGCQEEVPVSLLGELRPRNA